MKDDIVKAPPDKTSHPKTVDGVVAPPSKPPEQVKTNPSSAENTPAEPDKLPAPPASAEPRKPAKKSQKLPIIIAVFALIIFAGLAIYTGLSKSDSTKSDASKTETAVQTSENNVEQNKQQATDIVNQINDLQDDTDTSGDGLTDQKLGL